ncbi:hypothetical protein HPB48_010518 [Haemaphysalis longicornis]|uniref:Uncharacterized protein n=1 Tax=Haemaphysalis longicornis TaxID=44386 RepID=A0A9J6FS17_HAELO|nr:hypothetical protein HPB48_010518 [Haemaphysalis longicornis]
MSFADEMALLQAKLKVAEAELAAERLRSERLRSANNATASPIGQQARGCSEMDGRLDCMSMLQGVLVDMPSQEALVLDWFAGAEARLDSYCVPPKWRAGVILPYLSVRARRCLAGLSGEQRKSYAVLKAAVLKGLRLASVAREPVVASCGGAEHSGSMAERPRALQDAAARESREESDAVDVAHTASFVSGDPQMSCCENVIAMGSSYELEEESVTQCTAAYVMQPQAVTGRTAGVAEPTVSVRGNVTAKLPSPDYADQQCVVEHGAPSAEAAEPEGSPRKGRKRQPASPQCSVAATQADEPAAVPSRARKRGGEGFPILLRQSASPQCSVAATQADEAAAVPSRARKRGGERPLILLCEGVRRMARAFSDDDGRCVPPLVLNELDEDCAYFVMVTCSQGQGALAVLIVVSSN